MHKKIFLTAILALPATLASLTAWGQENPNLPAAAVPAVQSKGAPARTDFDIRLSDEKEDHVALERMRDVNPAGRVRARAARGQQQEAQRALEARTHNLEIFESRETGAPEVVAPVRGKRTLTGPKTGPRERIARDFLEANAAAYGLSRAEAARLLKDADYTNPAGNLHWVRLQQRIHHRPVFRGEITIAMTPSGEIVRTTGQLATAIDENEAPKAPVISAAAAVSVAAAKIGVSLAPGALVPLADAGSSNDDSVSFDRGPFTDDIKAELIYFPLGDGSVDLAWSMVLWTKDAAYWSIVDASSGERLFQKNLTSSVVNSYSVYPSDSPAPLSPGPLDPTLGTQGVMVARSLLAIDELSTTMNDPWLGPGVAVTSGNNVEAGLDIVSPNGVDAPVAATAANTFDYAYNPPPGNPAPGDAPTTANSRSGAVVNLFYLTNRYHDQLYDLGFTEAAHNFQTDNYGRGGVGGDRISAEAQDFSGTNGANFSAPPDGGRGAMQLYVFTGPAVDRDSALDAEVVYHELTHGTSNRLHGNSSGLNTDMARGMEEGWSDFYALSLLSEASDPVNGIYAMGGYATYNITAGFTGNYYYGVRRFPFAPRSFLGSSGKPHNPLTFADIDGTQKDLTDGAFPRGPIGSNTASEWHNVGEVWASALWDARANLILAHGQAAGNQTMLQDVTDGMKLDPVSPTFLQARDSIIAADCAANAGANELGLWAGFATRGMGLNARILNAATNSVVEDFTGPTPGNLPVATGAVSYVNTSCGLPGRNPIPGEAVNLTVGLGNPFCTQTYTNVVVSAQGGGSVAVGTVASGASTTATVPYTIPANTPCGSTVPVILDITSGQGAQTVSYDLNVGPNSTATVSFSNTASIAIPHFGTAEPYPSPITVAGVTAPVLGIKLTLHDISHTFAADLDMLLVAPDGRKMIVMSDALNITQFVNNELVINDRAATVMPSSAVVVATGATLSYKPTDYFDGGDDETFAATGLARPYMEPVAVGSARFSDFAGMDPNGAWKLYIVDDTGGDLGTIADGWTLGVVVGTGAAVCTNCGGSSLGGTVSGLAISNSIVIQDNGGDDLTVSANGSFTFGMPPAEGAAYSVTVLTLPTTPNQTCAVVNGSGTMPAASVTNIEVTCDGLFSDGFE